MDVAVIGDEITPGHPNELTDKTLIGHQTVCCGRKPHYHPLLQMAKWVKSNLRAQRAASYEQGQATT